MSKTTEEHLASLRVFDPDPAPASSPSVLTTGIAKRVDTLIVASQATAEIFLSAVLGMYMTMIYARHRPVRLGRNPGFAQLEEERRQLDEAVAQTRQALAVARGEENRLQNELTVFVAFAKSLFQKETALRQDRGHQQRRLLQKITEQFQTQLEAARNGHEMSADGENEPRALGGQPPA